MTEKALKDILQPYSDDPFNYYYCFESFTKDERIFKPYIRGLLKKPYNTLKNRGIDILHEVPLRNFNDIREVGYQVIKDNQIESLGIFDDDDIPLQFLFIFKINKNLLTRLP